ncbi:hypothetical protein QQX98_000069 [Neonectria punicea]|uniref:F-box domain-containing protein n=1 Tax=Neonectria punicea TaxID=979145 RepID=A0ABR1HV85_9HYPO
MGKDSESQTLLDQALRPDDTLGWASLPVEIRLMILEMLMDDSHGRLASYASVCKEWWPIIERKNFSRLKLRVESLEDFNTIVTIQRRGLIKHIWLDIELEAYICEHCKSPGTRSRGRDYASKLRKAIPKIFSILSTWDPAGDLTLELSAQSPNDPQHCCKHEHFGDSDGDLIGDWETQESIHLGDPRYRWTNGHRQWLAAECRAIPKLFLGLFAGFPEPLPEVHAVTNFVLRRQLRRSLGPSILKPLLEKLPRLECVVYEPWRVRLDIIQKSIDNGE